MQWTLAQSCKPKPRSRSKTQNCLLKWIKLCKYLNPPKLDSVTQMKHWKILIIYTLPRRQQKMNFQYFWKWSYLVGKLSMDLEACRRYNFSKVWLPDLSPALHGLFLSPETPDIINIQLGVKTRNIHWCAYEHPCLCSSKANATLLSQNSINE